MSISDCEGVCGMNHLYTVEGKLWRSVLRVLTLITLFVGAYSLVQSVLTLIDYWEMKDLSMMVVVIYLLVTPFAFAASVLWAYSVHRMAQTANGDMALILGFAMMIMASVDNLIYISIHHEGDSLSFFILGGIKLICFILGFLYYQGVGNRAVTLCSSLLLVAAGALELEEAVRYFISIEIYEFGGYYFMQTLLEAMLAVESLLFVFGIKKGYIQKR